MRALSGSLRREPNRIAAPRFHPLSRQSFTMKRFAVVTVLGALAVALLLGQELRIQLQGHAPMEVMSVFPRETQPGQYQQVDQRQLEIYADQGWELVTVTPFVYRNEEHGSAGMSGPRPVVTQTYPAYFFRRPKAIRQAGR